MAGQADEVSALKKENEFLKAQMSAMRSASAISGKGKVLEELSIAKALVSALTETNIALRTERILLEQRVAELSGKVVPKSEVVEMERERNDLRRRLAAMSKELGKRRNGPDTMPEALQRQLEVARARLEVYESAPVPYGPEEAALLKKADATASAIPADPAPRRLAAELPTGTKPLFDEAQKALDAGRLDEAEQKFRQILRQDDKNVQTMIYLASVQLQKNQYADAEKTLRQAIAADPSDAAAHYSMGVLKYRQDKFDEALDSLSLAAKLYPDRSDTQYFLGKTFLQKGNRAQAEKALRKAIQLRPGWGEAHFSLAVPPFKELAQWHYQKALTGGYPRDPDFEKLVEDKKTAAVP
jgi:tetratricopeptide (TPR) repeat protein